MTCQRLWQWQRHGSQQKNPDDLTDAAFLLSFGAILGILLLCPIFQEIFAGEKKWLQTLSGSLAITVILHPILSFFYYEISLYAIVSQSACHPSDELDPWHSDHWAFSSRFVDAGWQSCFKKQWISSGRL